MGQVKGEAKRLPRYYERGLERRFWQGYPYQAAIVRDRCATGFEVECPDVPTVVKVCEALNLAEEIREGVVRVNTAVVNAITHLRSQPDQG